MCASSLVMGQGLGFKGQFWTSVTVGDDPAPGRSDVEQTVGYIPSLSLAHKLGPMSVLDLEVAYNLGALFDGPLGSGEASTERSTKPYRLWGRFATESLELRLGLQKIAFGPGRVLRPLMWFDTFDLKDPTGQTEGVGALRLKWYPWRNLALWGWIIRPDYRDYASPGGRIEATLGTGYLGLTYHRHKASSLDYAGYMLLTAYSGDSFLSLDYFDEEEDRFALDARWDGFVGLWTEAVLVRGTQPAPDDTTNTLLQLMVGGDYTLPWGNGVYVMMEHLWRKANTVSYEPLPLHS
ncbi:MAG: hypothetical protein JSW54_01865 [Fidelibacterota bacterium]|nr:MAG: hypothetical protein JSW54_01865 [Candidatus Neomarinimicrobiota bacterium]